jgi:arsenate reductase-like glutaredoxin family protein
VQDNNLLKRPILVHPKGVIIGFDPAAYAAL